MGNCLVTKLKDSVNADLPVLNQLKLKVVMKDTATDYMNQANYSWITSDDKELIFKILSDTSAVFSNNEKIAVTNYGSGAGITNATVNEVIDLSIEKKYDILVLGHNSPKAFIKMDLSQLTSINSLRKINIAASPTPDYVTGNLSDLPNVRFEVFNINNNNIYGDYAEFVSRVSATSTEHIFGLTYIVGDLSIAPSAVKLIRPGKPHDGKSCTWTPGVRNNATFEALAIGELGKDSGFETIADVNNFFIDNSHCNWTAGRTRTEIIIPHILELGNNPYVPSAEAQTAISNLYSMGFTSIKVKGVEMSAYRN